MKTLSSRRLFIRRLVATALAAPLATQAVVKPGTRVLIIGAGVSGLAAARDLKAAGCVVTVLEARSRIGGRIVTDRSTFGLPVEMGAQFIHGQSDGRTLNPIWDIAKKQGWSTVPFSSETGQTYRNGVPLTDAQNASLNQLAEDFLDWVVDVLKETVLEDSNTTHSIENALVQFIRERKLSAQQVADLRAQLAIDMEGDLGGDTPRISTVGYDEDREFANGGDQIITGGYDQLPTLLSQGINIITDCIVRSVTYTAKPINIVTNKGNFACEYVLITVPLGVLKKGNIAFTPALPTAKRTAISRMSMGLLDKVILRFPRRFWPSGNWFANIEAVDPFGYAFSTQEASHPGSNILVAWQFGQLGVQREAMTDAALVALVMTEVRRCFKGIAVPDPIQTAITRWSQDPFSGGSYSFPCVGSPRSDIRALAASVNRSLYFAGEATHADYPGTVHGAYLSGLREAKSIITAAA
jgi:monoamine oxidase